MEWRLRHNDAHSFIGCYHTVGLRSIYIRLVYFIFWFWFRVGLGFEYHLDNNADLFDR